MLLVTHFMARFDEPLVSLRLWFVGLDRCSDRTRGNELELLAPMLDPVVTPRAEADQIPVFVAPTIAHGNDMMNLEELLEPLEGLDQHVDATALDALVAVPHPHARPLFGGYLLLVVSPPALEIRILRPQRPRDVRTPF